MFCEKCGNKMETGDVFCGSCGEKVSVEPVAKPKKNNHKIKTNKPKKEFNTKKVLIPCIAILIIFGIGLGVVFLNPNGIFNNIPLVSNLTRNANSVDDVIDALDTGNYEKAVELSFNVNRDELRERLENRIDELAHDFDNGHITAENVIRQLDAMERMDIIGLSTTLAIAREHMEEILRAEEQEQVQETMTTQEETETSPEIDDETVVVVFNQIFEMYMEFLMQREFEFYLQRHIDNHGWNILSTEYTIIDIDGDGIPELIISSDVGSTISLNMIFTYDPVQDRVIYISTREGGNVLQYSQRHNAIVLSHARMGLSFVRLEDLRNYSTYFWLLNMQGSFSREENGVETELTDEDFQRYINELIEIEFSPIPVSNIIQDNTEPTTETDYFSIIEMQITNLIQNKLQGLSNASYTNNANLLTRFINPNSELYQASIDLINHYEENNITVLILEMSIDDIRENGNGSFLVDVRELFEIYANGSITNLIQVVTYTVIEINNEFLINRIVIHHTE